MRVVLAGIIGRYPWGGVTWCSLMYLLGLRRLGHDVYYLEDTCECNYDPAIDAIAAEPDYALRYIHDSLAPFDMDKRWCYVDYRGIHHGPIGESMTEICRTADVMLVLSGGCWNWREHYLAIPMKAFIDSDPAFTQQAIADALTTAAGDDKKQWYVEYFKRYDRLFTFGSNIGTACSQVPTSGMQWLHTWQPICTDLWSAHTSLPPRDAWTTVMTWVIESFKDIGGNKDQEFLKILELSNRCRAAGLRRLELAVNGPTEFLGTQGWRCVNAFQISSDPWRYHAYITNSYGEFSVAKHTYVASRSGWFSDRTACYLAAGRPAVVQETGMSENLPTGCGLLTWRTIDDAFEALQRIERDYSVHSHAARAFAEEHFEATIVLRRLMNF